VVQAIYKQMVKLMAQRQILTQEDQAAYATGQDQPNPNQ
jgi:hypothetical protein